jgi:hypothetical protein
MTIHSREFYRCQAAAGNEDCYSLGRDTETGRVFVRHCWEHPAAGGLKFDYEISVQDFLANVGSRQSALLAMIGTLVSERG